MRGLVVATKYGYSNLTPASPSIWMLMGRRLVLLGVSSLDAVSGSKNGLVRDSKFPSPIRQSQTRLVFMRTKIPRTKVMAKAVTAINFASFIVCAAWWMLLICDTQRWTSFQHLLQRNKSSGSEETYDRIILGLQSDGAASVVEVVDDGRWIFAVGVNLRNSHCVADVTPSRCGRTLRDRCFEVEPEPGLRGSGDEEVGRREKSDCWVLVQRLGYYNDRKKQEWPNFTLGENVFSIAQTKRICWKGSGVTQKGRELWKEQNCETFMFTPSQKQDRDKQRIGQSVMWVDVRGGGKGMSHSVMSRISPVSLPLDPHRLPPQEMHARLRHTTSTSLLLCV